MTPGDLPAAFESGVSDYFDRFSHRLAREVVHQSWLLGSAARLIDPQLVVAELMFPNHDLSPFAQLKPSRGAIRFDFAVTNTQIDLRHWKVRTPDWIRGVATAPQTLEALQQAALLAEFKLASSSSTSTSKLITDLEKLKSAIGFMAHHGCTNFPACFLILLDPDRVLKVERAIEAVKPTWPTCTPFPKVLVGP
jgi:hypothetical protein